MAASSSSCLTPQSKYDVFLSFRGEDTRETFTSHLFANFCQKKIKTFMDEDMNKGDEISPALLNVIEVSKISVIVFSKNYASSEWCLDELIKILECKEMNSQIVIPVFYHVEPSHVRNQTGSFGKAFGENEKNFKKMPEKVLEWRDALSKASYLSGYESMKIRPEAKLVDVIVKDVLKKLEKITISIDSKDLIGIESRIEQVKSLLEDFQIIGIWGMGGIGKTTLAEATFNRFSVDFEGKFFMANVREKSEKVGGLEYLQKEVFSGLLEEKLEKEGPNMPQYTKERLRSMKVFIVLDDVDKLEQLKLLEGGLDQFGSGSRIIITSRDRSVLDNYGVESIYKVENLENNEALELFCNNAFRKDPRPEDLIVLSERVLDYAKGNPLAITVLGSFFYRKSKQEWENTLDNLKQISNPGIYDVLRISYDKLNRKVKNIFLDIACFFKGYDKDHVTSISDDHSLMHYALNVLVDKSLITISCNKLEMHDLLQEMGQEIVCMESAEEPGKRSRLWCHEEICHVLDNNKGTDSVKGIFLDLSKIECIKLDSRAFANMSSLRLLKFYMPQHLDVSDGRSKIDLPQGLEYFPDELRYLHWCGYPLSTLPVNFNPKNLIELSMPHSKVEQLWEGRKETFKLKSIDLCHSQYLTRIPEPSETPNLERVNLMYCVKLPYIPSSIQDLNNLGILSLRGCNNLVCFPPNIHFRSPITIDLSYSGLREFPQISGKITELNLSGTEIAEVPPSVGSLTDLEKLDLTFCRRLKILSTSVCKLNSLRDLALNYCSNLQSFPEILQKMERLEYIGLNSTQIKELPSSIENVQGLKNLSLMYCSNLDTLPANLGNLKSLKFIHGKSSAINQLPPTITDLKQLEQLSFSGCKRLVLPSLSGLSSLKNLELDDCGLVKIPEDIGCLSSLESLNLKGNNFESLPTSMKELCKLREFILSNCNMLQSLPELPLCPFRLEATNCKLLQTLPELPSRLEELDASILENLTKHSSNKDAIHPELDFSNCPKLNGNTHNILADSQLRIQHMATASLKRFYEKEIAIPLGVSIYLPGSIIPSWFSNQSSRSSINIKLPRDCCDRNFIGFALCAVIAFQRDFIDDEDFAVVSNYHFKTTTKYVDRHFIFKTIKNYFFGDGLTYYSDHVYLGFDPCSIVGLSGDVSFDFSIDSFSKIRKGIRLKRCGVCPIYANPIESKPNTFTVNMLPPSEKECGKLHNYFHDEAGTSGTATGSKSIGRSDEEEIKAPQQQSSFLSQIFCCCCRNEVQVSLKS